MPCVVCLAMIDILLKNVLGGGWYTAVFAMVFGWFGASGASVNRKRAKRLR